RRFSKPLTRPELRQPSNNASCRSRSMPHSAVSMTTGLCRAKSNDSAKRSRRCKRRWKSWAWLRSSLRAGLARALISSVLQEKGFHGCQLDSLFRWIVRRIVHETNQPPAGVIDVEDVDAARILFKDAESLQVESQSVCQDSTIDAAMSHQQQ